MQIYQLRNRITNKSYVGKSKDVPKRMLRHKREVLNKTNRRLYDSMNHHGFDAFELIILEDIPNNDRTYSNEREMFWIDKLRTLVPNGYNMTRGGDGGDTLDKWTDDQKRQLWARQGHSRIGIVHSRESRMRAVATRKRTWKQKPQAEKDKISHRARQWALDNDHSPPDWTKWKQGQIGTFKGKRHSKRARKKMSIYRTGKTYEELFDVEMAKKLKEQRRQQFTGKNNPNYVDFTIEQKGQALSMLQTQKIPMCKLVEVIGVSKYIFRTWLKSIKIFNYQKIFQNLTQKEWCQFWSQKYVN